MSDRWLRAAQDAGAAVTAALEAMPGREERERLVGPGVGGDDTTGVDAVAEEAVVAVLERVAAEGVSFTLVSEELGERAFGDAPEELWVVVDPIDGSLNAKRGIPFFSLSIAVADGPAMGDVFFGYVLDLGTREVWTAVRGEGARLDGRPLAGPGPKETVEILSMEATTTQRLADKAAAVAGWAHRTRVFGSLALSLCHLAAGRIDAVCSLKGARSVDIAAGQLLVREAGLAIELPEDGPFEEAPLDLEPRSRVVAAGTPAVARELFARISA